MTGCLPCHLLSTNNVVGVVHDAKMPTEQSAGGSRCLEQMNEATARIAGKIIMSFLVSKLLMLLRAIETVTKIETFLAKLLSDWVDCESKGPRCVSPVSPLFS